MTLAESAIPPSIIDFLLSRFQPLTVQVGKEVRNEQELADLENFTQESSPLLYAGLAGSRRAGKILIPREKLPRTVTDPLPGHLVDEIVGKLPHFANRVHGCARIAKRPSRGIAVPPANAFMYDIDLVVVPEDPNAACRVEPRMGVQSGTHFDIITVSLGALGRADGFFRSAFLNSRSLRFA